MFKCIKIKFQTKDLKIKQGQWVLVLCISDTSDFVTCVWERVCDFLCAREWSPVNWPVSDEKLAVARCRNRKCLYRNGFSEVRAPFCYHHLLHAARYWGAFIIHKLMWIRHVDNTALRICLKSPAHRFTYQWNRHVYTKKKQTKQVFSIPEYVQITSKTES